MNIVHLQNKMVEVANYQATFLTLKIDEHLVRFDIINKKEFRLKKGTIGKFSIYEAHPLLMDYNENMVTTYINSKPSNFDHFVSDFKNAIDEITQGWRNWKTYLSNRSADSSVPNFLRNVRDGSGILFLAPFSITEKLIEVCTKHHVAIKTFGNDLEKFNFKLIFIADNYVIAKDFRTHDI